MQARDAAPPNGDVGECSRLFAGKPGASVSTRCESNSDNLAACGMTRATPENQQETATSGILRDHTPTISRSFSRDDEMVRPLRRRRENDRNDRSAFSACKGRSTSNRQGMHIPYERNSLSGKFRPARMAQRLGRCLNQGLGEIAIRVKMLVTRGRTERP